MPLPLMRSGATLLVKERPLAFSFYPMGRTTRRYGLQSHVFSRNPWAIMRASIEKRCSPTSRPAALAFLEQAEDFHKSTADSGVVAAKPLLLYYCFLNLAKAYITTVGRRSVVGEAMHGLSEGYRAGGTSLGHAFLKAFRTDANNINVFDDFLDAIGGVGLPRATIELDLKYLLPQILPGHRLWSSASNITERFIAIERIEFVEDATHRLLWLRLFIFSDDLRRLNLAHRRLLSESRLANDWQEVRCNLRVDDRRLLCFEERNPSHYNHRPSDEIPGVVERLRKLLWTTVLIVPPYRRYYLYLAPPIEHAMVLPQILSLYAVVYYLGSVTRYRPHEFSGIVKGAFGAQVQEIITTQANQFFYLLASDFAQQQVKLPAIV